MSREWAYGAKARKFMFYAGLKAGFFILDASSFMAGGFSIAAETGQSPSLHVCHLAMGGSERRLFWGGCFLLGGSGHLRFSTSLQYFRSLGRGDRHGR